MTDGERGRCAIIANPIKVSDGFRGAVTEALREAGWAEPLWLETSADDPGRSMTATAVAEGVDLVIAAGGDGTVRVVADGLAGTGIPMGIVPEGTANLLSRNLGIPQNELEAIAVALTGRTRAIDLVKLVVDGNEGEHFAVMAGMGIDAMIMDETSADLKDKIGPAAYVVAGAKALGRLPVSMRIKVDDHRTHRRRAMICVVGNVSTLTGNLVLIPGAKPDDGLLDVYVASPHRFTHWVRVFLRLVTRRRQGSNDRVDQWRGRRVEVVLERPDNYQLDGDVVGELRRLVAEIQPQALSVRVPA
jgi:YegS/Rv2252/BmrU family lipid kinase